MNQTETFLCALARLHQTDKGGKQHVYAGEYTSLCHAYTPMYDALFQAVLPPESVRWMLEIGVHKGCSLRMWQDYFSNAGICGFDANPDSLLPLAQGKHSVTTLCDSTQGDEVRRAMRVVPTRNFDVIVDDGSHVWADQRKTLHNLLPYLAFGGVYVVEDIEPDRSAADLALDLPFTHRALTLKSPQGRFCACGCGYASPFEEALIAILPFAVSRIVEDLDTSAWVLGKPSSPR